MKLPKKTRYDWIMKCVYEFLVEENIKSFPVDPYRIIRTNSWGLISYSELARENNLTIEQVKQACQSEDGYVIYDSDNYTIAYNDTIGNDKRIRFTLMHEIGHIKLNHLIDFEETLLARSSISKNEYDVLEREASAFARNVLSPPLLIDKFTSKFGKFLIDDISECFKISPAAAKTRMQALKWDLAHMKDYVFDLTIRFRGFISLVLDSKQCLACRHHFISRFAKYCPVCAHTKFSKKRGENYMIYSGFDVDENSRVHECARCNNEEIGPDDEYCKVCASPVVNRCTSVEHDYNGYVEWSCQELATGNARYCTKCGGETVFLKVGLLKSWEDEIGTGHKTRRTELEEIFSND